MSKCDLFVKIFTEEFNKVNLENEIRKIWKEICDKYRPNKWKKEFRKEFLNYIKLILDNYPLSLQFKLLKLYEILEEDLENFAKTLEKKVGRKTYKPEIPSAKEVYKDIILSSLNIKVDTPVFNFLNDFPKYAALIEITFTLKKPYLSKDDENFYVIDNPIVKDKVFKLPMVRSTTWKGALRFAAIKVFENWVYDNLSKSGKIDKETVFKERLKIVRLFGNEKGDNKEYLGRICVHAIEGELPKNKEELKGKVKSINEEFKKWLIKNGWISKEVPSRSGRLFFYPTFFDQISLDVITPLNREKKTPVRGPVYFEIIPEGAKGMFRLLYYPFDLIARGEVEKIEEESKEDMELLGRALKKMFTKTGFSAKKMSGFGSAEVDSVNVCCGEKLGGFESTLKDKLNGILGDQNDDS